MRIGDSPACEHCGSTAAGFAIARDDEPTREVPLREDVRHEERALLRKLRVLHIELVNARGAARFVSIAWTERVKALIADVEAEIAREEARTA